MEPSNEKKSKETQCFELILGVRNAPNILLWKLLKNYFTVYIEYRVAENQDEICNGLLFGCRRAPSIIHIQTKFIELVQGAYRVEAKMGNQNCVRLLEVLTS